MTIKNAHFVDKYYWIVCHPLHRDLSNHIVPDNEIDVLPSLVDPEIGEVNLEDDTKNTKVEFWAELSYFDLDEDCMCHDYRFDCGGDSFEEAVESLFQLVYNKFSDYTAE